MQNYGDIAKLSSADSYMSGEAYLVGYDIQVRKFVAVLPEGPTPANVKRFISDTPKILVRAPLVYYHLLIEFFAHLARELELHDGSKRHYIFPLPANKFETRAYHTEIVFDYFEKKLRALGHDVDYCTGMFDNDTTVLINNFITFDEPYDSKKETLKALLRLIRSDRSKNPPDRKMYISRAKSTSLSADCTTTGHEELRKLIGHASYLEQTEVLLKGREQLKYQFTDRIDDEEALENYLRTLGFEIVYPEDFKSFEEQIHTISSAKMLMAITSSALASSIFMSPSSIVVELTTALVFPSEKNEDGTNYRSYFQEHYSSLCKSHEVNYVSIPHRRITSTLIKEIEASPILKLFLSS